MTSPFEMTGLCTVRGYFPICLMIWKKACQYWMLHRTHLSQLHLNLAVVCHFHRKLRPETHVQQLPDGNNKNQIVLVVVLPIMSHFHWRLHSQGRLGDTRMNFVKAKGEEELAEIEVWSSRTTIHDSFVAETDLYAVENFHSAVVDLDIDYWVLH